MKNDKLSLMGLFFGALIIRLLFSFYYQQFYFGGFEFKYGDGLSYLEPILNLIDSGEYRGDRFLDDSRYFRPPVYPFFLGIIYLATSPEVLDYAVAFIQCLIGAISVPMVYCIVNNICQTKMAALLSAIFIALYPFVILWTPLMYTETIQLFLIFSLIYFATNKHISIYSTIMQGVLVGLILLTKQYLVLISIIPVYIIFFASELTSRQKAIHLFVLCFSFFIALSPWLVRNYISSGNVIVFFGKTSGLRNALDDAVAFTQFANKFDENTTKYMKSVADTGEVKFTTHTKFLMTHERDIAAAALLAYQCGGSFQERRKATFRDQPPYPNCNHEVVLKFDALSTKFWQEVPFWEALETRRYALWKVISKSDLVNNQLSMNENSLLKYFLFKYRMFLLLLGFCGMLYLLFEKNQQHQRKIFVQSLFITAISFYFFFCLILVSAEMRYLLTPDVLLTLLAGIIPANVIANRFAKNNAGKN
jgi:4-amino-4-deoxy-L-arabinose transferase-like glycosyltransferase